MHRARLLVRIVLPAVIWADPGPPHGYLLRAEEVLDLSFCSPEVETPHVKWAKPYAGGATSAAFFLLGRDAAREVPELAQRFDLRPASSLGSFHNPMYDTGIYYGRLNPNNVQKIYNDLLAPGRSYEVLVFCGGAWDALTHPSKARAREMVRAGAGLVWIDPAPGDPAAWEMLPLDNPGKATEADWSADEEVYLTQGIPWKALPRTAATRFGEVRAEMGDAAETVASAGDLPLALLSEYGRGRVVTLTYLARQREAGGLLPRVAAFPNKLSYPYWEYHYALVGRAILYAARKESETRITSIQPPAKIAAGKPCPQPLTLVIHSPAPLSARLRVQFLDVFGQAIGDRETDLTLERGKNTARAPLPALPAGLNLAHLFVSSDRGVLDFAAVALPADSAESLEPLQLDREAYRRDETMRAEVRVRAEETAGLAIEADLTDGYGREMFRREMPAPGGTAAVVEVPLADAISMLGVLEVRLRRGGQVLDHRQARFAISAPRAWDEFESIIWAAGAYNGGHEHLFEARLQHMKRMGMTGLVLNPSDHVPAYLDAMMRHSLKVVTKGGDELIGRAGARYGALLSMWGDEQAVREDAESPNLPPAFRAWARSRYPSLAALNESWNARYESWDEVLPMTSLEDAVQRNRDTGFINFAPWCAYRDFLDWGFARQFQLAREALERGDPEARLGISGTQEATTHSGNDWWLLTRVFKALQSYSGGDQYRLHRSFSDMPLAPWTGYGKKGPRVRQVFWHLAFAGMQGVSFFAEGTLLNPDFTWFEGARDTRDGLKEIQTGPGKLLMHCPLVFDPIALHYSQRSLHAAYALGQEKSVLASRASLVELLAELGYQHFYLSHEQVEQGLLNPGKARLFLMNGSVCVSAAEAKAIRDYAAAGGTVVADLLPGAMDEHGRAALPGPLDELFGIRRAAIGIREEAGELVRQGDAQALDVPAHALECSLQETGIHPDSAQVLAQHARTGTPAILYHPFGKGKAFLLNGNLFSRYVALRAGPAAADSGVKVDAMESLFASLLAFAGLKARSAVQAADGFRARACSIFFHRSGRSEYVGLLRNRADLPPAEVTVRFPDEAFTYDMIQGRVLGRSASAALLLGPHSAHLLARLPYEVQGIEFQPEARFQPGQTLRSAVRILGGDPPDLHVVRMEVTDPSGASMPHYGRNLLLPGGMGEAVLPFALNDPRGVWTVMLRDVVSGVTVSRKVQLE
ncbi:MAG: beta-galactosidase trimerization domain-containing protein [Planctomycetes bacterium]|nr:beta-galactosidase trimerization domain-containing protein [Planctomycetota bacterium]